MNERNEERLLELLSDRAVFGLTAAESAELAELELEFETLDKESFELAAAAVAMVGLDTREEMPAHVAAKVLALAPQAKSAARVVEAEPVEYQKTFELEESRGGSWNWLGWAVAAFASLALAANIYTTRIAPRADIATVPTETIELPKIEPTVAQQREALIASAGDLFRSDWGDIDPKKPFGVKGDVVWSQSAQKGYLRFTNIPVNDRTRETYQLWIFDAEQKHPVDGGVFDAEAGEIIIPIDAKIAVRKPTLFAVTVEKPGGVVVSDREKILVAAKVAA